MAAPERLSVAGKYLRGAAGGEKVYLRGITYGPFPEGESVEPGAGALPVGDRLRADLDQIAGMGVNLVRIFTPPTERFLDACAERGVRVMAGATWASHVDFLRGGAGRASPWGRIVREQAERVRRFAGHSSMAVWIAGNEVEAGLARWMKPARVLRAIEDLIDAMRTEDPAALFAYANYPSTEYLNPRNADFVAFNLYLEERGALASYARRLQVLAGDRPVVVTEFGADAAAHGEDGQASILRWAVGASRAEGLAGFVAFAFTDEWWRGGEVVTGWRFGVTRGDRSARPAAAALSGQWSGDWLRGAESGGPAVGEWPRISVIVCTHNGAATLGRCLDSLLALRYPDFQVILVDDGSTDATPEVTEGFARRGVVCLRQEHSGLSAARNRGAAAADGAILAYTDDDCIADEDWLDCLARAFGDPGVAAAGGPNIPPEPRSLVEACVAAAPGAPSHVLLDDRLAEHLPGCNLAVRRAAFDRIGGFREEFTAAGDDVDFCWRLIDAGERVEFVPAAMVWHHRRATAGAYCRQQAGYGRAEALLIARHPGRFGRFGGARWRGAVYGAGPLSGADPGAHIYHGMRGFAPYQFVYGGAGYSRLDVVGGFRWTAAAGLLAAAAACGGAGWVFLPGLMLSLTLMRAVVRSRGGRVRGRRGGAASRWLLFVLHVVQPVIRGGARFLGCVRNGFRFGAAGRAREPERERTARKTRRSWIGAGEGAFWSEEGADRSDLLGALRAVMDGEAQWQEIVPDAWDVWDAVCLRAGGSGFVFGVRSATEYHGRGRCLTRTRVGVGVARGTLTAYAAVTVAAAAWVVVSGSGVAAGGWPAGLLAAAATAHALGGLVLARRFGSMVREAARRAGMTACDPDGGDGNGSSPDGSARSAVGGRTEAVIDA